MLDFSGYLPDKRDTASFRKTLEDKIIEIEKLPLTKEKYREAVSAAAVESKSEVVWYRHLILQEAVERKKLFFEHARKELRYGDILEEEGAALIERIAFDRGHANGFSEVFMELQGLDEMVEVLSRNIK